MKKFYLTIAALIICSLTNKAQIYPGSIFSLKLNYDVIDHNYETWTTQGYTVYNIQITKDANGYITNMQSSTPPPLDASLDQYKTTGSRTGNVYTSNTLKKVHGETTYRSWRRETWQGNGNVDTTYIEQDSINGNWSYTVKRVLYYTGNVFDSAICYVMPTNTWIKNSKTVMTYVAGKRNRSQDYIWNSANSTWDAGNHVQYFYSNKLDSMHYYNKINNIETLKQRYFVTCDGSGKTIAFTTKEWSSSSNSWKDGIGINFSNSTNVSENNNDKILVYPNPAKDKLYINGLTNSTNITVFDISGKMVINNHIDGNQIDISNLQNGIYTVNIEDKSGIITKKFIKE